LPAAFSECRFETTSFHITPLAILQGFALVTAISASGAQRKTMLTNILQRAPKETLGQNPLDREVYNILLAAARNKRCKTRLQNPLPSTTVVIGHYQLGTISSVRHSKLEIDSNS
jgi:hypothetical protein